MELNSVKLRAKGIFVTEIGQGYFCIEDFDKIA